MPAQVVTGGIIIFLIAIKKPAIPSAGFSYVKLKYHILNQSRFHLDDEKISIFNSAQAMLFERRDM